MHIKRRILLPKYKLNIEETKESFKSCNGYQNIIHVTKSTLLPEFIF